MKGYLYELHCHTTPVSACSRMTVRETLEYYKAAGYDGVFITNHFIDGNMCWEMKDKPYAEQIEFYFSDYERALALSDEIGIKVFCGIETSYFGMDALVYGLDKQWFLAHPEITDMTRSDELDFFRKNGAFVTQAHPFRHAWYIDRIQLFVQSVDAFETVNAHNTDEENRLADVVADSYGLIKLYGSDIHYTDGQKYIAGVKLPRPINSAEEFFSAVRRGEYTNCVTDVPK